MNINNKSNSSCHNCLMPFDQYCKPKLLPCGSTICTTCEFKIYKIIYKKKYSCIVCNFEHEMTSSGLLSDESAVINKVITPFVLLTSEYYQLGLHLNQIKSYIQYFENYEDISLNSLYEYCKLQNNQIQTASEIKILSLTSSDDIEIINMSNEEMIVHISEYEKLCNIQIQHMLVPILINAKKFLSNSTNQLENIKDDIILTISNKEAIDLKYILNNNINNIRNLVFNGNKIKFNISLDLQALGSIQYDTCFKVSSISY